LNKRKQIKEEGPNPYTLVKKFPFFPLQSSLHFILEPPPHTCKEKTLNSLLMATNPTLLHQLGLLLQSKRRDAKRKGGERCIEKGGRGNCFCVYGMQRAKFKF